MVGKRECGKTVDSLKLAFTAHMICRLMPRRLEGCLQAASAYLSRQLIPPTRPHQARRINDEFFMSHWLYRTATKTEILCKPIKLRRCAMRYTYSLLGCAETVSPVGSHWACLH